jgi:hypothetical protein
MAMSRRNSTTVRTGDRFRKISNRVSPSTKTAKPVGNVFGTSSQFKGTGVGVKGDVRK